MLDAERSSWLFLQQISCHKTEFAGAVFLCLAVIPPSPICDAAAPTVAGTPQGRLPASTKAGAVLCRHTVPPALDTPVSQG
jgi:hypothetical protein